MGKGVLFYNTYTFPLTEMAYKNWRMDIPANVLSFFTGQIFPVSNHLLHAVEQ